MVIVFLSKQYVSVKLTLYVIIGHCKEFNGKNWNSCSRHDVIKQLLKARIKSIDYMKSKLNLADLLTELLRRRLINKISREMRLQPI